MEDLSQLHAAALAQLASASTLDQVEAVRVEFWGRKGRLATVSKEFGKLSPEERARNGKLLNEYKQAFEQRLADCQARFETSALNARLDSEWLDLTAPAPGPRP